MNKKYDIRERSYDFALKAAKFVFGFPKDNYNYVIGRQLLRSATSVAANIEEADGTLTKADYIYTMNVARKEAKEARLWLRLVGDLAIHCDVEALAWLKEESQEIIKIVSRIILNKKGL